MASPTAPQSVPTATSHPIPCAGNSCRSSGPFACPTSLGGRAEGAQIGVFRFGAPSFTSLNTKEQQFTGHPLLRKPNEVHKRVHRLPRLSGEGLVRLKLAGITVTPGVQLLYSSDAEMFFVYFPLLMQPGHTQKHYEIKKNPQENRIKPAETIRKKKPTAINHLYVNIYRKHNTMLEARYRSPALLTNK